MLNVPEQIINGLLKRLNPKEPSLNDFLHQRLSPIELEIIDLASKLEGLKRHHTTHAAGIIIAPKAITEYASLEPTSEAIATTQMTMDDLEEMGLLKMDFLALKTLTILKDIEAKIRRWNPYFNLADIPKADPETFKLLQQGRTFGVFQLESTMFQELLKEFKPDKYGDLIAILALGRPGPMSHRREYVLRKSGKKPVDYLHPKLEPILEETFGFMIYQEQVIQIAHQIGGLSLSEADIMRVAMGKKDARFIENLKIKFIKGAVKNGLTSKQAEELFAEMERFAGYAFNKSHSACYALISWQMAYLKANFPYEFYVSLLNFKSDLEEIHACLEDCMNEGIEILPPDVVYSQSFYAREGMAIRVGLGKLKFMNKGIADEIIKQRTFRSFVDLADFLNRIRLNENIRHSLELSGSFRTLAPEREFPLDERNTIGTQLSTYNAKVWDPLLEELKSVFPSIVAGRIEEFLIDQGIPKGVVKGNGRKVRFQLTKSAKDFRRFFRVNEVIALLGRETNKDNVLFVEWALPLKSVLIISPLIKELGRLQKYLHQIRGESPVVFKFNSGELQLLPPKFWVKEGMINATELDPLVDQFRWIRDSLKGID